ncbi:MAG: hypothetical protein ACXAC5_25425 [Promethearchaeota archaeon]
MFGKFQKRLPYLVSIFAAFIWGIIYWLSANLHGMQSMFDPMFPFFIAKLFGFHYKPMSVISGTLFAALDAGIIGGVFGYLVRLTFYKNIKKRKKTNSH